MHRLLEWLTDALNPTRREQRLAALRSDLETQTVALFQRFIDAQQATPQQARQQAEDLVRALQARATQHGNLLGKPRAIAGCSAADMAAASTAGTSLNRKVLRWR
ncbi:Putative bacterial virulence factor [Cedecea neteri]|uniref:Bacterial virulence factor n=1 Tax=Cedecea neteri TaxID=158822 RepID=A0A2X3KXP7_9ENTR|nr:Putative bacterial virulence factor [Cedecea neteri]